MLCGGNPAAVPQMQAIWRRQMRELLGNENAFDRMLANYDPPQGNPRFLRSLAGLLEKTFGWPVTHDNVAVTNGTQCTFFFLFNLLAGEHDGGLHRKILLPMSPEYMGYTDQGLDEDLFVSCRSSITWPQGDGDRVFKYRVDFAAVEECLRREHCGDGRVAALEPHGQCAYRGRSPASFRPCGALRRFLIVDGGVWRPVSRPRVQRGAAALGAHVINTFSLSKLGLPGVRTGIVVGPPEIIAAIQSMTAIAGLANGNVGQQLLLPLLESGEILQFGPSILAPFYEARSAPPKAVREFFGRTGVHWAIHASEGAFSLALGSRAANHYRGALPALERRGMSWSCRANSSFMGCVNRGLISMNVSGSVSRNRRKSCEKDSAVWPRKRHNRS